MPHRLVCRNSAGESVSIIAIIKTQGSDTKLVAQMQPYFEAKGLSRFELKGKWVPPLVTQIADGENGGVMMNEFPSKFFEVMRECSGSMTPAINVSEYLERLFDMGIGEKDLPELQPLFQKRIWDRIKPGDGPEKMTKTIAELKKEDNRFSMEGGSWTNNISWVRGYDSFLGPMERASALFYEKVIKPGVSTSDPGYKNALFHLLTSQTSCYRYWGEGLWTDYGKEIVRRIVDIINFDIKLPKIDKIETAMPVAIEKPPTSVPKADKGNVPREALVFSSVKKSASAKQEHHALSAAGGSKPAHTKRPKHKAPGHIAFKKGS
jgi:hypothetical protein